VTFPFALFTTFFFSFFFLFFFHSAELCSPRRRRINLFFVHMYWREWLAYVVITDVACDSAWLLILHWLD
jgi:hypothetical protein